MSSVAFPVHLRLKQGGSLKRTYVWKIDGEPVDLTGATARAQIRKSYESAAVILDMTTANGRLVLGGVEGTVGFDVSDEDTAGLPVLTGVFDLFIDFPDGTAFPLMEGPATVHPRVTRA